MIRLGNKYTIEEKKTFRLHLIYSIIEGVILGVLALNEFVFIKSLHGSNYELGVLFQLSAVVFILLVFINEFIKRARDKKKLLRWVAIATRGPLILLIFFPASDAAMQGSSIYHYIFLVLFLVYFFGNVVIYPLINLFLKNQYRHENFGKLYSYTSSVNKIVMLISTFFYGVLLDIDNYAFRYVFIAVAILGIVSIHLLSMIDYSEQLIARKDRFIESVRKSIRSMVNILRSNKPYLHFEGGFMLYGFAFMITVTVITIFFERALHLNYTSVAFYKNAYNILAIVLLPYTGKLLGKIDPRNFAIITFSSLMLFITFVMLTNLFPYHVSWKGIEIYPLLLIAYMFYGVFASTMALLWFIGSAYFCGPEEAGDYQSVHLSLAASRAMFAPLFGIFFYELVGFTGTFMLAIASLLLSIVLMTWSYKRDKVSGK